MQELLRDRELFEPTLRGVERRPRVAGERPWRLRSQFYVAFFGGPLAVAAIAWANAGRLGMKRSTRWLLALAGVAGFVAAALVALVVDADAGGAQRFVVRLAGVGTFGALYLLQRTPDRVYHAFAEGDEDAVYDRMWVPGLVATIGLGALQAGILALVLGTDA